MADRSAGESFGALVLGGVAGFSLYLLAAHLGFGGRGRGEGGEGDGAFALPKDEKRLTFAMTQPTKPPYTQPMAFDLAGQPYSLEGMIARVKAGGRSDMVLKIRGNVLQGAADAARARIKQAGLDLWEESSGVVSQVSGNGRGEYGRRRSA